MKKIYSFFSLLLCYTISFSQQSVFDIMNREDLSFDEAQQLAQKYFDSAGTGQGSGYKQYQRWKFERKFHLDENDFFISPTLEQERYQQVFSKMAQPFAPLAAYTELGPWSWTYTSGWNPGVGRITCIAVYPADTTIIYVSSPGGGIWKSTNSGTTWQPLVDNNNSYMNVFHLAIDPSNSNIVYAAVTGNRVIKSINGGINWVSTGAGPSSARKILINPANTNIVFATSSGGIYKSTNGGTTWVNVHNTAKEDIEFKPGNTNIMYASGTGTASISAVYKSADAGDTWTPVTVANGITNFGRTLLGVSPNNPEVVYAVQASGSIFGRMYRSDNSGVSFITTVTCNPSAGTNYFGYTGTGTTGQATYDMGITVNPLDAGEVHIAGIICWKSLNAGVSFSQMTVWSYPNGTGYNHADVHGLEWVGKTMYSCSDGGVYKSLDNADNWINLSTGLGIRQFYRFATAKTNADVISGGAQDNGTVTRTTTGTWRDWLGADGMESIIDPNNANVFIGTSQNGSIYKTTNGGISYSGLSRPAAGNWVTPLVWHPTNSSIVYGGWDSIYKSINTGSTWTNISIPLNTGGNLDNLKIAPSNDNYIYASRGTSLFVTTNGGTSWSTYILSAFISSIEVKYNNPSRVWVTTTAGSNNVLVSINAGASFTAISTGLPAMAARSIAVDDTPDEGIYVGMNIGVYYKDLVNTSWVTVATGLPQVAVNEIEISKLAGKLRVATYGRGIWEAPLILNGALPVNWLTFEGKKFTNKNQLHWKTDGHNDDVTFTIQRSKDGVHFTDIGNINAGAGRDYNYDDDQPVKGNNFYRILSLENGKKIYSSIILIKDAKDGNYLTLLQNPVTQMLRFSIKQQAVKDFIYSIYNGTGMLMYSTKANSGYNEFSIAQFASGTYILEVNIDGVLYRERFFKQ
jgi:photosystem II stability/assembly factor-like uncharacterized protein